MILLIFISSIIHAQDCPSIKNDIARLACFDKTYTLANEESNPPKIESGIDVPELKDEGDKEMGNWIIKNHKDNMTGVESWQAILTQSDIENNSKRIINSLVLSCYASNKPLIAFIWGKYIGLEGKSKSLLLKIDNGEVYSEDWRISSKYSTSRYTSKKKDPVFLKKLANASIITARVTPYGSLPITAEFELDGISQVVDKIKNECPGKLKYWK